jgi:hypothetical protein
MGEIGAGQHWTKVGGGNWTVLDRRSHPDPRNISGILESDGLALRLKDLLDESHSYIYSYIMSGFPRAVKAPVSDRSLLHT